MDLYVFFLLAMCAIEFSICETVDNSTTPSRREVLEARARNAYQNACYRLQELSNWMSVVFKIKSVWASSTVNQIASKSDGILNDSDRWIVPNLPSQRPKTVNSECSLRSMQVTAQTYAYLQSQMLLLKIILGRNVVRTSKVRFDEANMTIRERLKMLDTFNSTLNDIFSKLKQNTEQLSMPENSENWKAWKVMRDIQEGRFLNYLSNPAAFFRAVREENVLDSEQYKSESKGFFQNLGKTLDKILFSTVPKKPNSTLDYSDEQNANTTSEKDT